MIKNTPNQGLKKGNRAIEESRVEIIKFIGVILNIYNNSKERMKCQNTMKNVAWIKSVIEDISWFLLAENNYLNVLLFEPTFIVSKNVVIKVVTLNTESDNIDRIHAKLPKKTLNKLDPVLKTTV